MEIIMKLKSLFLTLLLLGSVSTSAFAADTSRQYDLSLTANGKNEIQANTGDIITVTAMLRRTDSTVPDTVYGFQDEIRYDDGFIQIVDGMTVTADNIKTNDIGLVDGDRAFYVNFLSFDGNTEWPAENMLVNFQVKVLGEKGATRLKNENIIISTPDGKDTYQYSAKDLIIVVTSECTITFDSKGGTAIEAQIVQIGDLISKPEDPEREGYVFAGWFSDIAMTEEWDFTRDIVFSNMTLYAKWNTATATVVTPEDNTPDAPFSLILAFVCMLLLLLLIFKRPTVTYIVDRKEYMSARVKKNNLLVPPQPPYSPKGQFAGWYKDGMFKEKWNFDSDTVKKSIKLYAKFE